MRINGLDTMRNLVGEPPMEIPINKNILVNQQGMVPEWNSYNIGIVPYCFKCKVPLLWVRPPYDEDEEGILFICPKCNRHWVKGEGWAPSGEPSGESNVG